MAGLLDHPAVVAFDARIDAALDSLRGRRAPDRLFYTLTEAANHSLLWHGIAWARAAAFPGQRRAALETSVALAIESAVVNGPVKMAFRRGRPLHEAERPHALRVPKTSSFPSGHATSALCAAALLGRNDPLKPIYYATAALVATSRVYVRIHHASDVVAGALIGAGFGAVATRLLRKSGS